MAFDVWLENRTPFAAATHVQLNADGQEVLVAMLSASFESPESNGALRPAAEHLPVTFGDVPFGDPSLSSNRYEADIAPVKPAAEVIVNATAHAPNGKPVREMQVGLSIGNVRKVLNVAGDRVHRGALSLDEARHRLVVPMARAPDQFSGLAAADPGRVARRVAQPGPLCLVCANRLVDRPQNRFVERARGSTPWVKVRLVGEHLRGFDPLLLEQAQLILLLLPFERRLQPADRLHVGGREQRGTRPQPVERASGTERGGRHRQYFRLLATAIAMLCFMLRMLVSIAFDSAARWSDFWISICSLAASC